MYNINKFFKEKTCLFWNLSNNSINLLICCFLLNTIMIYYYRKLSVNYDVKLHIFMNNHY